MTYQEFNKKALDYYILRYNSTLFNLSLDDQEFKNLITLEEVKDFYFLKFSWNCLLEIKEDLPQYFGLIAIQCYAASLMHNDGYHAEDNYKVRLSNLLSLEDENTLQNLFIGEDFTKPIQEEIWENSKIYLEDNFNKKLDIPDRKNNAGRYVQYPKSQALLNTEDLKYFTPFFSEEFQLKEIFSLDYFNNRLNARFKYIEKTSRASRLFNEEDKRDNCIKQVYDYYNLWDGQVYAPAIKEQQTPSKYLNTIAQKIILLFDKNQPKFYVIDQQTSISKEISTEDIFTLEHYKYIYNKDFIIFKEIDHQEEYEDSRFIYSSFQYYILIDSNLRLKERKYLERNNLNRIQLSSNLILYKYFPDETITESPLSSMFHIDHPVLLKGGLKINRKNEYLNGYGPSICYDKKFEIIYEFKKCEYKPESPVGLYKVRTENYRDIEFYIVENKRSPIIIQSKLKGWHLKKYTIENDSNLEGCCITRTEEKEVLQEWINANLKKEKGKKYEGGNILIKVLNNSSK
jgi:hypothetical protein